MDGIRHDPGMGQAVRSYAGIAGLLYLYIIVAGVGTEAFVRGALIDYGDAAATARAILAHPDLYRAGLAIEMVMHLCDVGVAVLLYRLLKPEGAVLALFATLLRVVLVGIAAVRSLLLTVPLVLLGGEPALAGLANSDRQALALAALQLHGQAYNISLVFFGICCLALAPLLARSRLFSPMLGLLIAIAGICYLVNSFSGILAPALQADLFPFILLPCLVAEIVLTVWLLVVALRGPRA